MKRKGMLVMVLCLTVLLSTGMARAADPLEELDALWDMRHELENVQKGINKAYAYLEEGDDPEIYWRLSRLYFFHGEWIAETRDELLNAFEQGRDYAEKAADLGSDNPETYYWMGANIGRFGETRGILQSLFMVSPMHGALEQALELDPDHAGTHYLLSLLYRKVPGWPLSIGDMDLALEHAEKALEIDPTHFDYLINLAEVYLDMRGQAHKAKPLLEKVLDLPIREDGILESKAAKEEAQELLDENF